MSLKCVIILIALGLNNNLNAEDGKSDDSLLEKKTNEKSFSKVGVLKLQYADSLRASSVKAGNIYGAAWKLRYKRAASNEINEEHTTTAFSGNNVEYETVNANTVANVLVKPTVGSSSIQENITTSQSNNSSVDVTTRTVSSILEDVNEIDSTSDAAVNITVGTLKSTVNTVEDLRTTALNLSSKIGDLTTENGQTDPAAKSELTTTTESVTVLLSNLAESSISEIPTLSFETASLTSENDTRIRQKNESLTKNNLNGISVSTTVGQGSLNSLNNDRNHSISPSEVTTIQSSSHSPLSSSRFDSGIATTSSILLSSSQGGVENSKISKVITESTTAVLEDTGDSSFLNTSPNTDSLVNTSDSQVTSDNSNDVTVTEGVGLIPGNSSQESASTVSTSFQTDITTSSTLPSSIQTPLITTTEANTHDPLENITNYLLDETSTVFDLPTPMLESTAITVLSPNTSSASNMLENKTVPFVTKISSSIVAETNKLITEANITTISVTTSITADLRNESTTFGTVLNTSLEYISTAVTPEPNIHNSAPDIFNSTVVMSTTGLYSKPTTHNESALTTSLKPQNLTVEQTTKAGLMESSEQFTNITSEPPGHWTSEEPFTLKTSSELSTTNTSSEPVTAETSKEPSTPTASSEHLTTEIGPVPSGPVTSPEPLTPETGHQTLTSETSSDPSTPATSPEPLFTETRTKPLTLETSPKLSTPEASPEPVTSDTSSKLVTPVTSLKPLPPETSSELTTTIINLEPSTSETSLEPLAPGTSSEPLTTETSPQPSPTEIIPKTSTQRTSRKPLTPVISPEPTTHEISPEPYTFESSPEPLTTETSSEPSPTKISPEPSISAKPSTTVIRPESSISGTSPEPETSPEPLIPETSPEPPSTETSPEPLTTETIPEPLTTEAVPKPLTPESSPEPSTPEPESTPEPSPEPSPEPPATDVTGKPEPKDNETTAIPEIETTAEPEESSSTYPEPESELDTFAEPGPDWEIAKVEWKQGWEFHVYFYGALFVVLGLYCVVSVIRLWSMDHLLSRHYFLTLNVLVIFICAFRAIYLLLDAYNSNGLFPVIVDYCLYNTVFPCTTAVFSILFYALLLATRLRVLSPKVQKLWVLIVIIAFHFVLSFTTDIVVGLYSSASVLLFVCQVFFIIWGLFMFIGYLIIFKKLYTVAINRQKAIKATTKEKKLNGAMMSFQEKVPKQRYTIGLAVKVTFVSAVFGLGIIGSELYGMFGVYGVMHSNKPEPWPWWAYHTVVRTLELLMCSCVAYVAAQPFKYTNKKSKRNCCTYYLPCKLNCCQEKAKDKLDGEFSSQSLDHYVVSESEHRHWRKKNKHKKQSSPKVTYPPHTAEKYTDQNATLLLRKFKQSMLVVEDGFVRIKRQDEIIPMQYQPDCYSQTSDLSASGLSVNLSSGVVSYAHSSRDSVNIGVGTDSDGVTNEGFSQEDTRQRTNIDLHNCDQNRGIENMNRAESLISDTNSSEVFRPLSSIDLAASMESELARAFHSSYVDELDLISHNSLPASLERQSSDSNEFLNEDLYDKYVQDQQANDPYSYLESPSFSSDSADNQHHSSVKLLPSPIRRTKSVDAKAHVRIKLFEKNRYHSVSDIDSLSKEDFSGAIVKDLVDSFNESLL